MNNLKSEVLNAVILATVGIGGWVYLLVVLNAAFIARTVSA